MPERVSDEADVVAFLAAPGSIVPGATAERHDTHGAHIFLAGDLALKIKRAVRYDYMDFSTRELRRKALERELEVNRPAAPEIYLGLVPITRDADSSLALDGSGEPVEWALRMRRFEQTALLSHLAVHGGLRPEVLDALSDEVHRSHAAAARRSGGRAVESLHGVIEQIAGGLQSVTHLAADLTRFRTAATDRLRRQADLIERRAAAGVVRRCHGDLHLENIVLWQGRPTLFDAIEFDEDLATVDTLYDLAFLLMDLEQRAGRPAANRVLNRYLWRSQSPLDLEGLALLPLYLALRAGVRAMVCSQRAHLSAREKQAELERSGRAYLLAALAYLAPVPPRLVTVGGYSGTGKSTLARALAPQLGPAPGALHLRSDLERKALHGADELERLPATAYTMEESQRVYDLLLRKARTALAAGHAVVVDAVFSAPAERAAVETIAHDLHVPFDGLWLTADPVTLAARITMRTGDASDATTDVLDAQVQRDSGAVTWHRVDAGDDAASTLAGAEEIVAPGRRA